eukprot:CAMPEP_0117421442 /NCGR_PEP_ID=MMETSP0758-20121206/2536_1 /TAXON_ID=63605 /ORGANISM="Percolomonas cosmopolitus, Strain AE-1 (ATCC 50343)" /LENGTH=711 /DNA_ID=CAMNT_0005203575 /DNA_START=473 /DNA_END=2605 /DNA_ORIENTATION=-
MVHSIKNVGFGHIILVIRDYQNEKSEDDLKHDLFDLEESTSTDALKRNQLRRQLASVFSSIQLKTLPYPTSETDSLKVTHQTKYSNDFMNELQALRNMIKPIVSLPTKNDLAIQHPTTITDLVFSLEKFQDDLEKHQSISLTTLSEIVQKQECENISKNILKRLNTSIEKSLQDVRENSFSDTLKQDPNMLMMPYDIVLKHLQQEAPEIFTKAREVLLEKIKKRLKEARERCEELQKQQWTENAQLALEEFLEGASNHTANLPEFSQELINKYFPAPDFSKGIKLTHFYDAKERVNSRMMMLLESLVAKSPSTPLSPFGNEEHEKLKEHVEQLVTIEKFMLHIRPEMSTIEMNGAINEIKKHIEDELSHSDRYTTFVEAQISLIQKKHDAIINDFIKNPFDVKELSNATTNFQEELFKKREMKKHDVLLQFKNKVSSLALEGIQDLLPTTTMNIRKTIKQSAENVNTASQIPVDYVEDIIEEVVEHLRSINKTQIKNAARDILATLKVNELRQMQVSLLDFVEYASNQLQAEFKETFQFHPSTLIMDEMKQEIERLYHVTPPKNDEENIENLKKVIEELQGITKNLLNKNRDLKQELSTYQTEQSSKTHHYICDHCQSNNFTGIRYHADPDMDFCSSCFYELRDTKKLDTFLTGTNKVTAIDTENQSMTDVISWLSTMNNFGFDDNPDHIIQLTLKHGKNPSKICKLLLGF